MKAPSRFKMAELAELVTEVRMRNHDGTSLEVNSVTNDRGFVRTEERFSKAVYSKDLSNYRIVPPGAFAYNPSRVNVGSISYLDREISVLVSPLYVVFSVADVLSRRYLLHYLKSDRGLAQVRQHCRGSVRQTLPFKNLGRIKMPLPPLPEQQRIAAILDKAGAVRRKRQQSLELADRFLRSAFLDMFGDPVTNPKHWPVKKLGEFADIRSGITKGRKLGDAETITVPYMRVANVQDGRLELADIKTIKIRPDELGRYSLTTGDVLLTEGGDPDKLGRGAVWAGAVDPCVHQNHIFSVRVDRSIAEPHFISALIGSAYGKRHFLRIGKQTTGIATINKTQLSSFPALLPPIKMQKQYAAIVARFDGGLGRLTRTLAKHEELSKSLTQRAFRGEL